MLYERREVTLAMEQDRLEAIVRQLREAIEQDTLPATVAVAILREKAGGRPSDRWSMGNRIIMQLNGTQDARGIRQWNAVGRRVRKGAKAFYILGPIYKRVVQEVEERTVDPATGEERVEVRRQERQVLVGFKEIPVFRYEDTEGDPLPEVSYEPPVLPPLAEVARYYGIPVRYGPFASRFYGYYRPYGGQEIYLCTHDEDVFFHELAHAAHHRLKGFMAPGQDPHQEMVAGLAAAILSELYGFRLYVRRNVEYARQYAQLFGPDPNPRRALATVLRVLEEAAQVVRRILEDAERAAADAPAAATPAVSSVTS